MPKASELIQKIQAEIDQYGDLEVLGYASDVNQEYDDITPEYNNDDQPIILLSLGHFDD